MRTELLRFNGAVERDPAIDAWMKEHAGELGAIAHQWFEVMRKCGDEVRELLHDGCPVACLGDAPFGYVNVFTFARKRGVLSRRSAAGSGPLVARRRQVHAPCEAETGNGHKRRSAKQAHRDGVLGYKGARRKRLALRNALREIDADVNRKIGTGYGQPGSSIRDSLDSLSTELWDTSSKDLLVTTYRSIKFSPVFCF